MNPRPIEHLLPASVEVFRANPEGYQLMCNWIRPWDFQEPLDVGIIGAPFHRGAGFSKGTHEAPSAVREAFALLGTRSFDFEVDIGDLRVRDIGDVRLHMTDVVRSHAILEQTLVEVYDRNPRFIPIVIGGDHAIAAPSARAFKRAHELRLGLVDFDAHNDLRSPDVEGPSSGTPFRQLIDSGYIAGRNAVQLGLHGFLSSPVLRRYADERGLRMISAREVRKRGIEIIIDEAIAQASTHTDGIYVSLDIDVMDPAVAPGTGAPTAGGLDPGELFEGLYRLGKCPAVKALDLVEIDPTKDVKDTTTRMAAVIIMSFLAGVHARLRGDKASWEDGRRA